MTAAAVLTFGLIMPGSASSADSAVMSELPDQTAALAANELLWQTFTLDEAGMPSAYPEEYGGAFIDGKLLYIYLVGLNDELEAKYMEICNDSPVVRFLEADYSVNYLTSANGVLAILTAGHCIVDGFNSQEVYSIYTNSTGTSNPFIGTPLLVQYANGESYDYAIIEVSSNYSATNDVRYYDSQVNITGYATSYAVGQIVYLSGGISNTITGTIDSINQSVTYDSGVTLNGVISVTPPYLSGEYIVVMGDSGGAAFGASSGNGYSIIGNISEKNIEATHSIYRNYISPIGAARSAGFSPKLT